MKSKYHNSIPVITSRIATQQGQLLIFNEDDILTVPDYIGIFNLVMSETVNLLEFYRRILGYQLDGLESSI
jgi:hypothetical protein